MGPAGPIVQHGQLGYEDQARKKHMNQIDKNKLTPEQLEQLGKRFGNKIQTMTFELTVAFNDLYAGAMDLPEQRVADGIKEILSIVWHVPAAGADKHIPTEAHLETCRVRDESIPFASLGMCTCGAYGEQGQPRDMWSLMHRFIKVQPKSSVVELISECPVNHEYVDGECPECGQVVDKGVK